MILRQKAVPDWLGYTIAVPLTVAISPALFVVACWVGLIWIKRKAIGPRQEWARWFAWYPVKVACGEKRWLEIVDRRSYGIAQDTQFRARR